MQTISIIIPAYNEKKRLPKTLTKWQDFLSHNTTNFIIKEILIVDDGSTDKTAGISNSFKNILPIKTIEIKPNQGKGNAVKAGVDNSNSDFIFIYDADAAVLPQELKKLFNEIKTADIVIGSRLAKGSKTSMSNLRKFIGKCFHLLCFPLIPKIKDASCGAKLLKTDIAKKIFAKQKIKRFAFDIEILCVAKKMGLKIKEVGIEWKEIPGSKVNIIKDGTEMLLAILGLYKRALLG